MSVSNLKNYSALTQAALVLDNDFAEFDRLTRLLQDLSINTEKGLERARTLLAQIEECSKRIGPGMQSLAKALDEARQRTEESATLVSNRALLVQERQQHANDLLTRMQSLGEMVRKVTDAVAQLKQPDGEKRSPEQQTVLVESLPKFNEQLSVLVDEARRLMDDAHEANIKEIERNADTLRQCLQAARNKLTLFVERQTNTNANTTH